MTTKFHGIKSLAEIYANKYGTSQRVAEVRIREFKEILEEGIADENFNGIQFIDSITLKRVLRKHKLARNPKTKEEVIIPTRVGVKAEIGKSFSEKLHI